MTQISKEQIEQVKAVMEQGKPYGLGEVILPHQFVSALITIGEKLAAGTHALVPIEPTQDMIDAGSRYDAPYDMSDCITHWKAKIRAAQGKAE